MTLNAPKSMFVRAAAGSGTAAPSSVDSSLRWRDDFEESSDLKIGNEDRATSTAVVNVIVGTVNITRNIRIADNGANSSGALIVGDGTTNPILNLNTVAGNNFESADNGSGVFTFNSGTINQANSNFIAGQTNTSSVTIRIGGGATPAIFNLNGGNGARDWNTNQGDADITILDNADVNVGRDVNLSNNAAGSVLFKLEGGSFDVTSDFNYRNNGDDEVTVSGGELLIGSNLNLNNPSSDATDGNVFSVVGDGATRISVGNNFNGGSAGTMKFEPSATGLTPIEVGAAVNTNGMGIAFDFSALSTAKTLLDIVLIDKNAAGVINGLFGGLAEGATVHTFGDATFYKLSYVYDATTGTQGTGNDLALIAAGPPEVTLPGIPDIQIFQSSPNAMFSVHPHFEDLDHDDDELAYAVTGNTVPSRVSAVGTIPSATGVLSLLASTSMRGTSDLTVTALDPDGGSDRRHPASDHREQARHRQRGAWRDLCHRRLRPGHRQR